MDFKEKLEKEIEILKAQRPGNATMYAHGMSIESVYTLLDEGCIIEAVDFTERIIEAFAGNPEAYKIVEEAKELLDALKEAYEIPMHTWGWSQAKGHHDSYETWKKEYCEALEKEIRAKEKLLALL